MALQALVLLLSAVVALAVVMTRDLPRLVIVNGLYSLVLIALFVVLGAPDVGLSELVVGAVAVPLTLVVTLVLHRSRR